MTKESICILFMFAVDQTNFGINLWGQIFSLEEAIVLPMLVLSLFSMAAGWFRYAPDGPQWTGKLYQVFLGLLYATFCVLSVYGAVTFSTTLPFPDMYRGLAVINSVRFAAFVWLECLRQPLVGESVPMV